MTQTSSVCLPRVSHKEVTIEMNSTGIESAKRDQDDTTKEVPSAGILTPMWRQLCYVICVVL